MIADICIKVEICSSIDVGFEKVKWKVFMEMILWSSGQCLLWALMSVTLHAFYVQSNDCQVFLFTCNIEKELPIWVRSEGSTEVRMTF